MSGAIQPFDPTSTPHCPSGDAGSFLSATGAISHLVGTTDPEPWIYKSGHRFQSNSPPYILWQVVGLRMDYRGLAHARLIRADDPLDSRVISMTALESDDLYLALDSVHRDEPAAPPIASLRRLVGNFLWLELIPALTRKPHAESRL